MAGDIPSILTGLDQLNGPITLLLAVAGGAIATSFPIGILVGRFFSERKDAKETARLNQEKASLEKALAEARADASDQKERVTQPARLWRNIFPNEDLAVFQRHARTKALVIANLKGGVGKSTLAASLACHFAIKRGLRVLLVDLDYQGTSSTLFKRQMRVESEDCRVGRILENPELIASLFDLPTPLGQNAANVSLLSADETLDEIENGLMLKSTFNKQQGGDVRLRLCRFLRSETIESRFDLVVIDTPPRFSAAAVNGLLAATHILVPTKMEDSSIGATLKFCDRLKKLQQTGYPAANFLGVVPVMTQARPHLTRSEIEACNLADDRLADIFGPKNLVIRDGWVPDTRAIGGAAQAGIAYMQDSTARAIFDDLGAAIQKRMG